MVVFWLIQEASALLSKGGTASTQKAEEYHALIAEFIVTASSYAQQIVDESALEPNERFLRSIDSTPYPFSLRFF